MDILTLKRYLCNVFQSDDSGIIKLKEESKDATLKLVYICDVPFGSLIIKMDKIRFEKFLNDNQKLGFNKHSDYLIVTEDKLVFIEMKSKREVNHDLVTECINKFSSDNCVLEYADAIFQTMLTKEAFFEKKETHYVLLYQNPSISKTTIALETECPNNIPKAFRKIPISNEGTVSFYRTI